MKNQAVALNVSFLSGPDSYHTGISNGDAVSDILVSAGLDVVPYRLITNNGLSSEWIRQNELTSSYIMADAVYKPGDVRNTIVDSPGDIVRTITGLNVRLATARLSQNRLPWYQALHSVND